MAEPEIRIDLAAIRKNAALLSSFCRDRGISLTGVTKATCAMPPVARAMLEGGVASLGESRVENIRRLPASGIHAPVMMLRIPPLSRVEEVVAIADISLNSELPVIRALSQAALKQGKVHRVILMVDLGDLREGIWPPDLVDLTREVLDLRGVRIIGLGTNLTCFGGVLPSRENMGELVRQARLLEETFSLKLELLSGGNSSSLPLLAEGGMPREINHLRLGESILLGKETAGGTLWPGCSAQAFRLSAEVIELKEKPSVPIGEIGRDAFGNTPEFPDQGTMLRAILNVGREDVQIDRLTPVNPELRILGASSDHLLLDVTALRPPPQLGSPLLFTPDYGALLAAMTSPYVRKTPFGPEPLEAGGKTLRLLGDSPLYEEERFLGHLSDMGFSFEIIPGALREDSLKKALREEGIFLIGGAENKTALSLTEMTRTKAQMGLIILAPIPSLESRKTEEEDRIYLSKILGFHQKNWDLTGVVSPESIVLIGLREASEPEARRIEESGITAFTMEDVDRRGLRDIMQEGLRRAVTGTDGFYLRIAADVVDAQGEGLTFREAHSAMEMAAETGKMLALDISGTPDRSWIDDKALGSIVESAFGKRILRLNP